MYGTRPVELEPRKVGNTAGDKVSCTARRAGPRDLVHGQLGCCPNWLRAGGRGQGGKGRSHLPLLLPPFCLQTETPRAPCRPCLQACPLATMTPPRTATFLDTTTCPPCGIPRHPHFGARTVEGPRWWPTCSCCPRLGTVPAVPCQEQGKDRPAENMGTFNRGRERRDGSQAPGCTWGHWLAGSLLTLFLTHHSPRPLGLCTSAVGGVLPDESDFILMSKVYPANLSCALQGWARCACACVRVRMYGSEEPRHRPSPTARAG